VLRRVKEPTSDASTFQTGLAADDSPGFALDFSGLGTMFPGAGNHSDPVPGPVLTDLKDGSPVGFAYGPSISGWCAVVRKAISRPIACCRLFRQARHFVAVLPSLYQPLKVLQPVDGEDSQYNLFLNGSPSLFSLCLNPDSLNYSGVLYWNVTDDTFAQTCTPVQLALESV
jgi:hypothetical protein